MYDYDQVIDTPPDLAYFMGAKICESYYSHMEDKKQANADIFSMNLNDPMSFLGKSKYEEKF